MEHFGEERTFPWTSGDGEELVKTSSPLVDSSAARKEFAELNPTVVAQHYPRDNMAALWQNIVKFHSDTFPNLLKLAQVALLLPVHTADVERGFSSQNCILTPKRNRLAMNTQNMLMKVKMEGEKE